MRIPQTQPVGRSTQQDFEGGCTTEHMYSVYHLPRARDVVSSVLDVKAPGVPLDAKHTRSPDLWLCTLMLRR